MSFSIDSEKISSENKFPIAPILCVADAEMNNKSQKKPTLALVQAAACLTGSAAGVLLLLLLPPQINIQRR